MQETKIHAVCHEETLENVSNPQWEIESPPRKTTEESGNTPVDWIKNTRGVKKHHLKRVSEYTYIFKMKWYLQDGLIAITLSCN